jgi:flagellar basal body L-ring protein FlgH
MKLKVVIRVMVLTLLAVGALAGCAEMPEIAHAPPPAPTPEKKAAPRELGSLWSDDSKWNYVYAAGAARVPGDIVTLRLDDTFKRRVARFKDGGVGASDDKADRSIASTGPNNDIATIKGKIEEVGTRGIYRVSAQDSLRYGEWEPYVVLKGRVKDRDISANDEIEVASLVDLDIEVINSAPGQGDTRRGNDNVSW